MVNNTILQQPIRIFEIVVIGAAMEKKNACYQVKEHKKLGSKVTLLFVWGHLTKEQTVERNIQPVLDPLRPL